jgi:hypothetical protein
MTKELLKRHRENSDHIAIDVTLGTKDRSQLDYKRSRRSRSHLPSRHRVAQERRPAVHPDIGREAADNRCVYGGSTTTSEIKAKDFPIAVVNEARLHHLPILTVRSILLELDLLSIDLVKNEVHILAGQKEFHNSLAPIRSKGSSEAIDDLPDYEDLRTAVSIPYNFPMRSSDRFAMKSTRRQSRE